MSDSSDALRRYLIVIVHEEAVAIDVARIREVIHCPQLTRMPLSPALVPGVINLRGAVVPVLDLAVRLDRPVTRIGKRTCIVVVEVPMEDGVQGVGLLVDSVVEAVEVTSDMIEPVPSLGVDLREDFAAAVLRVSNQYLTALDLSTVADARELEALITEHAQRLSTRAAHDAGRHGGGSRSKAAVPAS